MTTVLAGVVRPADGLAAIVRSADELVLQTDDRYAIVRRPDDPAEDPSARGA